MIAIAVFASVLLAPAAGEPVGFTRDVAPILVKRCLACHSGSAIKGGLDMGTFAALKKGGKLAGGEILVPGDPESSGMIASLRGDGVPVMPFKQPPLAPGEIAAIEKWIEQGVKFDGPSEATTRIASLVDPLAGLAKIAVKAPASDPVTSLAYSPDGSRLSAAIGRSVIVYDTRIGRPVATLRDHPGPVHSALFTPDGKLLVTSGGRPGQFGFVAVWDVATKTKLREARGHADAILCASLSPDGRTLATGSYDRLIKLWDVADGREVRTLKEHTDAVLCVAYSPDGREVASGSADRTVKLWDADSGKKRASLSDSAAEVQAVAFAPDGRSLLAAGADRSIRRWSLGSDTPRPSGSAFAHDGAVLRLVASPDGKALYSSGEDRAVKSWDLAGLQPRSSFADQSDWPLAIAPSPDGLTLAAGRYDGSIALIDLACGAVRRTVRDKPSAVPKLASNATLNPPFTRGASRGRTVRVTLSGNGVGQSESAWLPGSEVAARIVPRDKPDPNAIDVDLEISAQARVGVHRILVRTPLGVPASQPFAVTDLDEVADSPTRSDPVPLPACLTGAVATPGEIDTFQFVARAGQDVVFEMTARPLGSRLVGGMVVWSADGRALASAPETSGEDDPVLVFHAPADGTFSLRVSDRDYGGSGAHFYRIRAGVLPLVTGLSRRGLPIGGSLTFVPFGVNLGSGSIRMDGPAGAVAGDIVAASGSLSVGQEQKPLPLPPSAQAMVVFAGDSADEPREDDDETIPGAGTLPSPGGVSGSIDRPADVDLFRFSAKKGRPVVLEVFGRRLGSPIDPALEILDARGKPVPRAVLRVVGESNVAFRDHASASRAVRMTKWDDFAEGDAILIGRELTRISELPRNPDDDAVFLGTGVDRVGGDRVALLGTSPEHHPLGQAISKVDVHPPGAKLPAGGSRPVVLAYRNDDGGAASGAGKDPYLRFDPPEDGDYLARVADVRSMGGRDFGYQLVAREPRPDFRVSLGTENPNVPRGGTTLVQVNAQRIDGLDGPISLAVAGLPEGISAACSPIEAGRFAGWIAFSASETAPEGSSSSWTIRASAKVGDEVISHETDPGGRDSGIVTVTPEPNLRVSARPGSVTIRPGERVEVTFAVERSPTFKGRVPIEVRNLPRGVRVLDIGLNGVLVTEARTERSVSLYAEPWAEPGERPFFAVAACEAAGTLHASPPISLSVARDKARGR